MDLQAELVIFDVDGTLHDVEQWWPELIRHGLRLFATQTGLQLAEPNDLEALRVIGQKAEGVWAPFLPEGERHRWSALRALVLPMEVEILRSGRDYLFSGMASMLQQMRAAGRQLALASNCGAEYMAAMQEGQGLAQLTDWQFCLASPGVDEKRDMLDLAMQTAGTRKAVMVGDRDSDQEAAVAMDIPFIWRQNNACTLQGMAATWSGRPQELLQLLAVSQ